MSNHLKVAMIDLILSLRRKGWSQRRIATELGINRETVARYLKHASAQSRVNLGVRGFSEMADTPGHKEVCHAKEVHRSPYG